MEDKRRDAGTLSSASSLAGGDSPASEPPSSRRRAGGNKRKANNLSSPGASSVPSKRVTRDKGFNSHPPIHNGPLTRARQGPGSLSAAGVGGANASPVTSAKPEEAARALEELSRASREWEALEASIEAEVEAIRSRDSNSHVVPSHCGWFSWTKPHPIEELTLPSFFDGKSKARTSDMYMEIRNWIMKKFHADPNTPIVVKDLSELEVGDLDSRQEVMEFLDYWGLINFHPVLPKDSAPANADSHKEKEKDTSFENLYRFEVQQLRPPVLLKTNTTTSAMATGLFPESTIAEELGGPEGPSVEYHCNSCSADCSRKRYHCQKQADFDLCSNCFSYGKFGSNMSSSDFILMEPAELPGVNGGNWTDQETLLLLEALELYKENWNEIAEHVATKTKVQCILHFVQMPIEDSFLDYDEDIDANSKEPTDTSITNTDSCTPKDVPETTELKIGDAEGQSQTSPMETIKPEDSNEVKTEHETSKPDEGSEAKSYPEILEQEDTKDKKIVEVKGENCALKALRDAFEAIGYLTPEGPLSFADVGNPVMALAAYLAHLVEPDIATASAHGSLKSVCGNSSGMQLAARHCFLLEGPPDDKNETGGSGCDASGMVDKDAQNNNDDLVLEKKEPSSNDESNAAEEAYATGKHEDGSCNLLESNKSETVKDQSPSLKKSDDIASQVELPSNSAMDSEDQTPAGNCSHSTEATKDVEMLPNSFSSDKNAVPSQSVSKADVDMTSEALPSEKNEPQQNVESEPVGEPSKSTEDVDMVSSLPSVKTVIQKSVTTNSIVENRTSEEKEEKIENKEDNKGKSKVKKEKSDSVQKKDDQDIDKLKCAAVSALSAAAVKAKFLANQEEEQIKELAASLIEKQLRKLETKLGFFSEMDNVMVMVREQMDRSRQRLFQERAQIIAARLGLPAASSRAVPPSLPMNRIATNFANSVPRPSMMTMTAQKPPLSRPVGAMGPALSNPLVSSSVAGGMTRPSSQGNVVLK